MTTSTRDLLQTMIVGLASGTEEGRIAAEEAGRQAVLQKSAEVIASFQSTPAPEANPTTDPTTDPTTPAE